MKKQKRFRLSRRGKIVRNLALALLAAVVVWGELWFPIASPRLRFRTEEWAGLLGRSHIQGIVRLAGRWQVAAVQGDAVLVGRQWRGPYLQLWPRNGDGPSLVPIGECQGTLDEGFAELAVIAVDIPKGTASGRLEMRTDCWWAYEGSWMAAEIEEDPGNTWQKWEKTYRAEGVPMRDGGMLFSVVGEDTEQGRVEVRLLDLLGRQSTWRGPVHKSSVNCRMEAVFYDENEEELGRAVLATPGGGETDGL